MADVKVLQQVGGVLTEATPNSATLPYFHTSLMHQQGWHVSIPTSAISGFTTTTLTVTTSYTAVVQPWDKIMWVDTGGTKYGYVSAITSTLITIVAGNNTIVSTPSTVNISHDIAPYGFPAWIACANPTFDSSITTTGSFDLGRFNVHAGICTHVFEALNCTYNTSYVLNIPAQEYPDVMWNPPSNIPVIIRPGSGGSRCPIGHGSVYWYGPSWDDGGTVIWVENGEFALKDVFRPTSQTAFTTLVASASIAVRATYWFPIILGV